MPPKARRKGVLTKLEVFEGERNNPRFKIICPKNAPTENPKTLITEKSGIYPAKASIPSIKGIIKEKPIRLKKGRDFAFVILKVGKTYLNAGLKSLFIKLS